MDREEKILSEPVEINGIRIGDDRFKIKNNLDLNRKKDTIKGQDSVARSPHDYVLSGSTGQYIDATAEASGVGSYALGPGTIAKGHYSFAFGSGAYAIGNDSFCHVGRGIYGDGSDPSSYSYDHSFAYGQGSVSFNYSKACANFSFAEGNGITGKYTDRIDPTIGTYSHAEGEGRASGHASHAEGSGSAGNTYSHAEGYVTYAPGLYAHAEGSEVHAQGYACHAEGYNTKAQGYVSHASGYLTRATGAACFATGFLTLAGSEEKNEDPNDTGTYRMVKSCIATGESTKALADNSFSGGEWTRAKNKNSFAIGGATQAAEDEQVVIGRANIEKTNCALIIGGGSKDSSSDTWQDPKQTYHGNTPKNILEVSWDGNLWVNGEISCGENRTPILKSSDLEKYYTKEELSDKILPTISLEDNNKILSVVDGKWTAISIINSEGVAY